MSTQDPDQVQAQEPAEDAWQRALTDLVELTDEELWDKLTGMVDYRGDDQEQNLILAGLVHTLADRTQPEF